MDVWTFLDARTFLDFFGRLDCFGWSFKKPPNIFFIFQFKEQIIIFFPHHPRGDGSVFNRWVVRARARVSPVLSPLYILAEIFQKLTSKSPGDGGRKKLSEETPA